MHIERSVHGQRRVVSTRNGVRVVANGRRGGYVQRAYVVRGGRSYYSRTYYYHGAYRAGVYRGQCAEFCGYEHALMSMLVVAEPPADFDAWAARQREVAPSPAVLSASIVPRIASTRPRTM